VEIRWRLPVDAYGVDRRLADFRPRGIRDHGGPCEQAAGIAIGVLAMSLAAPGIASADEPLGQPMVTTTFGLGAGPMPDVATDPSTHTGRT